MLGFHAQENMLGFHAQENMLGFHGILPETLTHFFSSSGGYF
jgi:hypothetical protein